MLKQWKFESEIGPLYLVASDAGLRGIYWKKQTVPLVRDLKGLDATVKVIKRTVRELEDYFLGKRKVFTVRLDPQGTPFQHAVWDQLACIPFGQTASYGEIAKRIGKAKAVRAVGTANGRNPLAIIVPCHRVVTSGGRLGGFSGGLKTKERLLAIEGLAFRR